MSEVQSVGVIGLGSMGMGAAKSCARAGLDVYGFDLNAQALEELGSFGNDQVIIAYLSVKEQDIRSSIDVGVPPPALKPIHLPAYERYQLQICQKRKYLFSFQGREVKGREGLRQLIN